MSIARRVLPSRLELNRPAGSSKEAPFAKVIFTTLLYVSPVQMIPSCDHTGTPRHFHSSTTAGSASLMRARTRASVLPRQSLSSLILASINREGDSPSVLFVLLLLMLRIPQSKMTSAFTVAHPAIGSLASPNRRTDRHRAAPRGYRDIALLCVSIRLAAPDAATCP